MSQFSTIRYEFYWFIKNKLKWAFIRRDHEEQLLNASQRIYGYVELIVIVPDKNYVKTIAETLFGLAKYEFREWLNIS